MSFDIWIFLIRQPDRDDDCILFVTITSTRNNVALFEQLLRQQLADEHYPENHGTGNNSIHGSGWCITIKMYDKIEVLVSDRKLRMSIKS